MSKPKILLVEDEEHLAQTLVLNLTLENYEVDHAANGDEALKQFGKTNNGPDLVLLDVMLPGMSGFELCEKFKRRHPEVPVIFITARDQGVDRKTGLRLGADDYIVKPFDLEELLLRIRNNIKRTRKPAPEVFEFAGGKIDFESFEIVNRQGEKLLLSKREIGMLQLLTSSENKVVSRDEIIEKLWEKAESASSRTIDNYVLLFRKLFEKDPKDPKHFLSVRAVGYKFVR
jgi:two-component system alkaline phosphatase synthesis response regulator PhoP